MTPSKKQSSYILVDTLLSIVAIFILFPILISSIILMPEIFSSGLSDAIYTLIAILVAFTIINFVFSRRRTSDRFLRIALLIGISVFIALILFPSLAGTYDTGFFFAVFYLTFLTVVILPSIILASILVIISHFL